MAAEDGVSAAAACREYAAKAAVSQPGTQMCSDAVRFLRTLGSPPRNPCTVTSTAVREAAQHTANKHPQNKAREVAAWLDREPNGASVAIYQIERAALGPRQMG